MPLLWGHWIFNKNYCGLTMLENFFRGKDLIKGEGFISSFIRPIFEFPHKTDKINCRKIFLFKEIA